MSEQRVLNLGRSWRMIVILTVVLSALLATTVSANASTSSRSSQSAVVAQTSGDSAHAPMIAAGTAHGCPYYYFCAFSGRNFTGTKIQMYYCQFYTMPFSGTGSWVNNQTPGTRAKFYDAYYNLKATTAGAYSTGTYNWTPIYHVKPC
jgi:hypothetical protein